MGSRARDADWRDPAEALKAMMRQPHPREVAGQMRDAAQMCKGVSEMCAKCHTPFAARACVKYGAWRGSLNPGRAGYHPQGLMIQGAGATALQAYDTEVHLLAKAFAETQRSDPSFCIITSAYPVTRAATQVRCPPDKRPTGGDLGHLTLLRHDTQKRYLRMLFQRLVPSTNDSVSMLVTCSRHH